MLTAAGTEIGFTGFATHPASGDVSAAQKTPNGAVVGGLVYDYDPDNLTWTYGSPLVVGDITSQGPKTVKGYAVYICDQTGAYPNFMLGGKP